MRKLLAFMILVASSATAQPDYGLTPEEWAAYERLEQTAKEQLAFSRRSLGFGADPTCPAWAPAISSTTGRTYRGAFVGGKFNPSVDPWSPGPTASLGACRQRYGTAAETLPHACVPGGGWCEGSKCGVCVHGAYAFQRALKIFQNSDDAQIPEPFRGIPRGCELRPVAAWDACASGIPFTVLAAAERLAGNEPGEIPVPQPSASILVTPSSPMVDDSVTIEAVLGSAGTCVWTIQGQRASGCKLERMFDSAQTVDLRLSVTWPSRAVATVTSQLVVHAKPGASACDAGYTCVYRWTSAGVHVREDYSPRVQP